MDAKRWARARALFEELGDTPRAGWERRLVELCPDDEEVRSEALALLEADLAAAGATDIGDRARAAVAEMAKTEDPAWSDRLAGQRVGPYALVRELGRGGMGAVWLAERADGEFEQRVAVKLIRPGWDAGELLRRFRGERQILAGLTHPNIAHLLDGGVTEDGKPWLALEYVDGVDLLSHCDRGQHNVSDRLRLFLTVCDAVTHAHARLVVHRDLKPSNLLVTAGGQVKLLDFGIAKLLDPEASDVSVLRVFTPEYAAPEQVKGELVTTAVDVYALGLLLYALLTGRRPYGVTGSTPAAYERAILDQEPTRPSQAVAREEEAGDAAALAANRRLTPERLRRELRGDLDSIVLKALRKEPGQRYAAVADLAADVQAYLERRPVVARRGGWRYRGARFLRRHTLAAALASVAVLAVVGGLAGSLWQAREARRQRDAALAEARKSRAVLEFMGGLFELADPSQARGERVTARELLDRGAERMRTQLTDQPAARAELLTAMASAHRGLGLFASALPLADEASRLARETGDPRLAELADLRRAEALHEVGKYREALALLDLRRGGLEDDDDDTAGRRAALDFRRALALQALNRFDESEAAYRAAYETQRLLYGEVDRRTQATAMRHVALYVLRDDYDAATKEARRLLAAVRGSTTADDPQRADALGTLAMVLSNTGPATEAEALRREELALVEKAFGPDHPRSVTAANDLAGALYAQRRLAEAGAIYDRILPLRRAQLGPDHPSVATVANNLAVCLVESDPARGKPYAEEALRIRLAKYGESHHTTAASLRALASIEVELGDLDGALGHLQRAVASYDAALGPSNLLALGAINDLARVEVLLGRPEPGCKGAERAHTLFAGKKGSGKGEIAYQDAVRAACWVAIGKPAGEPALRAALATLEAEWGAGDRRTRKALDMARAARRRGRA